MELITGLPISSTFYKPLFAIFLMAKITQTQTVIKEKL